MITPIEDHVAQALSRLFGYQADYTNLRGMISILAEPVQEIEYVLYSILTDTTLDVAAGANLDLWGALLGEARNGLEDDEYRRYILARAATRNSKGTPDEILNIIKVIAESPQDIRIFEFPAEAKLEFAHSATMTTDQKRRVTLQTKQALPAGVNASIVQSPLNYFGFAGNPNARGFGVGRFGGRIDNDY